MNHRLIEAGLTILTTPPIKKGPDDIRPAPSLFRPGMCLTHAAATEQIHDGEQDDRTQQ